jgi:hypothetical protein
MKGSRAFGKRCKGAADRDGVRRQEIRREIAVCRRWPRPS